MSELERILPLLLILFLLFMVPNIFRKYRKLETKTNDESYVGIYENTFFEACQVESWNNVTTLEIPNAEYLRKLADREVTRSEGLTDGELRLLSAYLYHDEIVVTTTRQRATEVGKPIHCLYYDCNRLEIPNSTFESYLFPMTSVHCLRRAGAEYLSLAFNTSDEAPEPIPFVKRLDEKPPHNLGVCVGQIFGEDRKWMNLVEFVEHHKIIGATIFYFTVFEIEEYSRTLLDDYVRTGYAEVTRVLMEYPTAYEFAHMIQIHDCFFRSRHHSKWVLNIDHDEYLVPTQKNFLEFIDSLSAQYAEIIFAMRRIPKLEASLNVYNDSDGIRNNLQMVKYNRTFDISFHNTKVMMQPTKVNAILLHWVYGREAGYKSLSLPKSMALINHYRMNTSGLFKYGWEDNSILEVMNKEHVNLLKQKVVETVEYVFKKRNVTCDSIPGDWKRIRMGVENIAQPEVNNITNYTDCIEILESDRLKLKTDNIIRLLASYQLEDHIAVTTSSLHEPGTAVHCFYYSNNHRLIFNSSQSANFSSYTYVRCPTEEGASFITIISSNLRESVDPVPIQNKVKQFVKKRKSICVGPIYGSNIHWMNIVKFIEYHRLIGFNYFYFTVFNISSYDQQIIDDYHRLGYIDVTHISEKRKMHAAEYETIQKQNCILKAKGNVKRLVHVRFPEERIDRNVNLTLGETLIEIYNNEETPERFSKKNVMKLYVSNVIGKRSTKIYKSNESFSDVISSDQRYERVSYNVANDGNYVRAVNQRVRYIYDKRKLYCDELNMHFFALCGDEVYHCEFRTYESEQHIRHLKMTHQLTTKAPYDVPDW